MRFMENHILNLKTTNSYLKKFEIATFNLSLLLKDNNVPTGFKSERLQSYIAGKKVNVQ
jgi:hypothetical protein